MSDSSRPAASGREPGRPALPISPPPGRRPPDPADGAPELHIEEVEERHVPKDRNIFDK